MTSSAATEPGGDVASCIGTAVCRGNASFPAAVAAAVPVL